MIILLHEFGAAGADSEFIKLVAPHFPDESVLTPTYPYLNANKTASYLRKFVELALINRPDDYELIFIGMNLGGFWARYLANAFRGSTLIMVNPLLKAHEDTIRCAHLVEELNQQSVPKFTNEHSEAFRQYFVEKDHFDLPITIIVADDDNIVPSLSEELIGSHRAMIIHTTGGHRMHSTLTKHIADIKFAVYNLTE